jgi:hypothetical protein
VNVSFLLPFLEEECQLFLRQHHLLLPGVDARHQEDLHLNQVGSKGGGYSAQEMKGKHDSQAEEMMRTIFAFSSPLSSTTDSAVAIDSSSSAAKRGPSSSQQSSSASMNRFVRLL